MQNSDENKKTLPQLEEEVLAFWEKNRIFEKTLQRTKGKKPFVFYEGPPTANAPPGLHHVEARTFKDIIPRYKTMRGFFVERKAGWDTHGLPVELQVEKALGLKSKKDIEAYGVARFNEACRASVWEYKKEWERLTKRIGFWLDLGHPYITYETSYIESLWWIIKEFWERGLLYQDFKVLPWCPRCQTGLSSHEVGLGYKKVKDRAVYVKFKLKPGQKMGNFTTDDRTFILSWTTTPWTLPGNVALAVNQEFTYVRVKATGHLQRMHDGQPMPKGHEGFFLLAKERLDWFRQQQMRIDEIVEVSGKDLLNLMYAPIFEVHNLESQESHRIYSADFVHAGEGTGVVHTAVMYGEEDYELGKKLGLPRFHTVDETGRFIKELGEGLGGLAVKDAVTEAKIIASLKNRNLLFAEEQYEHEYPFCWRCDSALLYYAREGWWVRMSQLKKELWKNNETINWVPEHIKAGRFGEFIKDVRDWAFSRERFWGTPLPIWKCAGCGSTEVIGSLEELGERHGHGKNSYIFMRHGEALSNVKNVLSSVVEEGERYPLTEKGKKQAEAAARKLKKYHIDFIYASPFRRVRETAEIVCGVLGVREFQTDARLSEIKMGDFEGKLPEEYHSYAPFPERFATPPPGKKERAESLGDARRRMVAFFDEMERLHSGKTILVVSHEHPLWLAYGGALGLSDEETLALRAGKRKRDFLKNAETIEVFHKVLPRDEQGLVNLHRPYSDNFPLSCVSCGSVMRRVPEVADVWFDSGAMPFAQYHFPFAFTKERKPPTTNHQPPTLPYPADYIAEAIDQTRGWFYTLLAVATALGRKAPYKNAISLGHVLDKNGQKMSKSRGNMVNPWDMIEKYGADALRWYFMTVNAPGDSKLFDERDVGRGARALAAFWNSFLLFDIYVSKKLPTPHSLRRQSYGASATKLRTLNILDQWIFARLNELGAAVTKELDAYDITGAARVIESFVIEDFSQWYLRRSRRRLQHPASTQEFHAAAVTTAEVLGSLCELTAPFAPFLAETVYQRVRKKFFLREESVHLRQWPRAERAGSGRKLLGTMKAVRAICSEALRLRAQAGIKVRQPLRTLRIPNSELRKNKELLNVIREEVNVKDIAFGKTLELDTTLTEGLKAEGFVRELIRQIQDARKRAGFAPRQRMSVFLGTEKNSEPIIARWRRAIEKATRTRLRFSQPARSVHREEILIENQKMTLFF